MAFRMGLPNTNKFLRISNEDRQAVAATLPKQPMLSMEDFEAIRRYYWNFANDHLDSIVINTKQIQQFYAKNSQFPTPFVTMLKADTLSQKLLVGTQTGYLNSFDPGKKSIDTMLKASPPSHVILKDDQILVSTIGILMPNDQNKGALVQVKNQWSEVILDSLHRPVYLDEADLDGDQSPEIILCNYGNFQGNLTIYSNKNNYWIPIILSTSPGAIKTKILDADQDGDPDILALFAQGDERMVLYLNEGGLKFKEQLIFRFPPVFGSSYFETLDLNSDGFFDILLTNGDNGDYSNILKPYHGIRLYLNDGQNKFKEKFFLQMPGASKAIMRDFDQDGDLDIAAISFFPDYSNAEEGFIYFKNTGNYNFEPQTTPKGADGRWLTMEPFDFDGDGDIDLFLGSSSYRGLGASNEVFKRWKQERIPILLLENLSD